MKLSDLKFILFFCAASVLLTRCGKTPASLPLPYTGNIHIAAAAADLQPADSIYIQLNDEDYGKQKNPHLLFDIMIGFHKLEVSVDAAAFNEKMVEVAHNTTTYVDFEFISHGPRPGQTAPDFSARDINGNPVSLQNMAGKAVLLAFFEHT